MTTGKPGASKVAFKWTIFHVAASILLTYIIQIAGLRPDSPIKYLGYVISIGFLLLTQKEYRDQLGGFMSFGDGFVAGLLYSVFSGLLLAVFLFLYYNYLSPSAWAQFLDMQREALNAQHLSQDQIDVQTQFMTKFGSIIVPVAFAIFVPIIGGVIALIGAAIFKKERTLADIENQQNDPAV